MDELIAALERLVDAWDQDWHYELSETDARTIRTHIADLKAGNLVRRETPIARLYLGEAQYEAGVAEEREKVVAWLRARAGDSLDGVPMLNAADALASGVPQLIPNIVHIDPAEYQDGLYLNPVTGAVIRVASGAHEGGSDVAAD